jgi:hypothetical protein
MAAAKAAICGGGVGWGIESVAQGGEYAWQVEDDVRLVRPHP